MVEAVQHPTLAPVRMGGSIQTVQHLCVHKLVAMEAIALLITHALAQSSGQVVIAEHLYAHRNAKMGECVWRRIHVSVHPPGLVTGVTFQCVPRAISDEIQQRKKRQV